MKALNNYLRRLHNRIKENKGTFILYTLLRLIVLVLSAGLRHKQNPD